jgi:hypothetical protein
MENWRCKKSRKIHLKGHKAVLLISHVITTLQRQHHLVAPEVELTVPGPRLSGTCVILHQSGCSCNSGC